MQPVSFDSYRHNHFPGLGTCPPFTEHKEVARRQTGIFSPSHLYLRGCLYYFRYKFPRHVRHRLGHAEFRMSLRTGYIRWAKYLVAHLHVALQTMISGDSLLNYNEICRRMNIFMQQLLEDELRKNRLFADTAPLNGDLADDSGRPTARSFLRLALDGMRDGVMDGIKVLFPARKPEAVTKESIAAMNEQLFGGPE